MTEENRPLSEEEIKKKAYSLALRLKHSGLDPEIIYARLEKQGIPEAVAKKAVEDLIMQKTQEEKKEQKPIDNINAVIIGIVIVATIAPFIMNARFRIIPVGLIISGIVALFFRRKRR